MPQEITIAIVEDDDHDRAKLKKCLNRYAEEKTLRIHIREFTDGEDLVTDYAADYDLILMDIEMQFLNGMKAAEKVREMDRDVLLIFITNMPQYAIEGYKVRAMDYMLKPLSYFSFAESMNRVLPQMKEDEKEYITIALRGGKMRLEVNRICYVEVQDHDIIYNTKDGKFISKGTMKELEAQLNPDKFCRCNRCYLVNLDYVENYQGTDVKVNGDLIQVIVGELLHDTKSGLGLGQGVVGALDRFGCLLHSLLGHLLDLLFSVLHGVYSFQTLSFCFYFKAGLFSAIETRGFFT